MHVIGLPTVCPTMIDMSTDYKYRFLGYDLILA